VFLSCGAVFISHSVLGLWDLALDLMALSIPSLLIPPGHLSGIFLLSLPKGGAFAKTGQPGGGALSKQRYFSDFKRRT